MFEWIGDAVDTVGGWFGGGSSSSPIGQNMDGSFIYGPSSSGGGGFSFDNSWLGRNWDNIGRAVNAGRGIYNLFDANSNRQGVRNDLLDVYQNSMLANSAYQQQMMAYNQAAAAAAAAARRKEEEARQKAAKKALAIQKKYLTQLAKDYKPYADAAKMLTPKMADNYKQYLDSTAMLNAYLSPKVMDQLSKPPTPSYSINIPQSAYSAPSVKSENVTFPTVEEMLNRRK